MTLLPAVAAVAQWTQSVPGISVRNQEMAHNGDKMTVSMELNLSELELKSNSAAVFVPVVVKGDRRQTLPAVGVYGRTSWYQTLRAGDKPLGGAGETSYIYASRPATLEYVRNIPYEEWMNGAELILTRHDYGCCAESTSQYSNALGRYAEAVKAEPYRPQLRYVRPVAEAVKVRALSGSAYIDFPVNRTELHPDYRNNRAELAKIIATIDSVRNDRDITVTSITIKGTASPEGTYQNNVRLAKGRTEALKSYVGMLYNFGGTFIATDYEPEDWAGLRRAVETSSLPHKHEILQIIDEPYFDPDSKESRIRSLYGDEYLYLLHNVYPSLRRSDYRIEYSVRSYNDVESIRRVLSESPQKLSLSEMYLLAQTMVPGSEEYNDLFETAARLYPDDETANLNAANAAMSRGDLERAERYLNKAGRSAEAVYARGVLAGLQGEWSRAEELVREAGELGLKGAEAAARQLERSRTDKAE